MLKVVESKDMKVRTAEIQLPGHGTVTKTINHLFPLKIKEASSVQSQPRNGLREGLNRELCLISFLSSWN